MNCAITVQTFSLVAAIGKENDISPIILPFERAVSLDSRENFADKNIRETDVAQGIISPAILPYRGTLDFHTKSNRAKARV